MPEPTFAVRRFDIGASTCVLILRGELDLATVPTLQSALHGLRSDGYQRVALDVSPLQFIDSTGLSVLLDFQRTLGQRLVLAEPQEFISDLLELAGLADAFDVFPHLDDAIARAGVAGVV